MTDPIETKENKPVQSAGETAPMQSRRGNFGGNAGRSSQQFSRKKNTRRTGREPRARSEFDQKLINIRRVARVSSGGRRFSFSVAMLIGNRRGSVGVGTGKGADTAIAIEKATRNAKQNLVKIATTQTQSISHRIEAKYSSARVMLMPSPGRGVVAGSAARSVLELAGIKDITAKIFSPSKNSLNTARATIAALSSLRPSAIRVIPSANAPEAKSNIQKSA